MSPQRIFRNFIAGTAAVLLAAVPATAQVRVGSKNFTEQFIVAEIYAQALEAAGIKVERKLNLGGTLIAQNSSGVLPKLETMKLRPTSSGKRATLWCSAPS